MTFNDTLEETYTALSANKVRSGLTVLGIVIGIASVIAMVSVGEGVTAWKAGDRVMGIFMQNWLDGRLTVDALVAPFTLENGMLTPSQKVKRHVVMRAYGATLEKLLV